MGLDMFLYEDTGYETTNDFFNEDEDEEVELVYWRKANAIHRYFCRVGQELEPEVLYKISREDLLNLLSDIDTILNTEESKRNSVAKDLLPTQSGFFFGNTEYDPVYYGHLQYTKEKLQNLLNNVDINNFIYYASW